MRAKLLLSLMLSLPLGCQAADFNWSAFGTAGYAISDQPYDYQRFISNQGTFNRDSVFGAQLDVKFSPQWGAAVQAKLAPSDHSDTQWTGYLSWAFISWRPMDDLLIRAGKLRVPLMLNTENQDVGATYDWARLPVEVYSIAPTTDFTGLSLSKSWFVREMEWTLEGYTGVATNYTRYWGRDVRDGQAFPGAWFEKLNVKSTGLVLTARGLENLFRAGVHQARVSQPGGTILDIPYQSIAPGVGFYDIQNGIPADHFHIPYQSLGASVLVPGEVRLTGEYARIKVPTASKGMTRWGAYLAVSRQFGAWTPYVYYAKTKSSGNSLDNYQVINGNTSPMFPPELNAYQRLNADIYSPYDQSTTALGTSYRYGAHSLIKAELSQTRTGIVSSFIDAPPVAIVTIRRSISSPSHTTSRSERPAMLKNLIAMALFGMIAHSVWAEDSFVLVGHSALQKTDLASLQRLYTGRILTLNQQPATPLSLPPGNAIRQQFLKTILGQNEEQYSGYWLVRRYVGKGTPPQEVASPEEIIRIVGSTPGAVGYLPATKVPAGSNIIFSP